MNRFTAQCQFCWVAGGIHTNTMKNFEIGRDGLARIEKHADVIRAKAMELTDTWGGAMFIVDPHDARQVFLELGFNEQVAACVYDIVRGLKYVKHLQRAEKPANSGALKLADEQSEFTWHGPDATCLVMRGFDNPSIAFCGVNDLTVRLHLDQHAALFQRVLGVLPSYAHQLMFSTQIGCGVLRAFGADISDDCLFDIALDYGGHRTTDLQGRRGVPTAFVRALTLTLSGTVQPCH